MALCAECDDALPASLSDLSQFPQLTNLGAGAELLCKLAPRDLLWLVQGIDFALRDGPGTLSLLRQNGPPGWTSSTSSPCVPLR